MGTFLFDSRIGCLGPNPPQDAQDFIENLQGFFKLMQPLMYNVPLYKIVPTKIWKQYEKHADNIFKIGRSFVDKVKEAMIWINVFLLQSKLMFIITQLFRIFNTLLSCRREQSMPGHNVIIHVQYRKLSNSSKIPFKKEKNHPSYTTWWIRNPLLKTKLSQQSWTCSSVLQKRYVNILQQWPPSPILVFHCNLMWINK